MATFQDYQNIIGGTSSNRGSTNRSFDVKIEFLRSEDDSVKQSISGRIIGGSLSIDNTNGVRRNIKLTIENSDKLMNVGIDNLLYVGRRFSAKILYDTGGGTYELPLGVFVMDSPSGNFRQSEQVMTISGNDKCSLLSGLVSGTLENIFYVQVGTNFRTAVQSVVNASSDNTAIVFDESLSSKTTFYEFYVDNGGVLTDVLDILAEQVSANYYYNVNGALVFEADVSDNIKGVEHKFYNDSQETNYIDTSIKYQFDEIYNKIVVYGVNLNNVTIKGSAEIEDLTNPIHSDNIGFERVLVINSDAVYDTTTADALALYYLKRNSNLLITATIESLPLFNISVDEVVQLFNDQADLDGKRLLIQSIDIDLSIGGTMSIKCSDTFELVS